MAEALGIAGSIIAVIQLSGVVVGYVTSLRGGSETKTRLRDELLSVSDTLSRINDFIDSTKGEAWATAAVSLTSPDGLLKQFEKTLLDLEKKLRPPGNRLERIVQPLRWPLDEKDVTQLLLALERYKTEFLLILQHEDISLSLEIRTQVSAVDSKLIEVQKTQYMQSETICSQENREVLAWLSPLDFSATYDRLISARQPGTGTWLLDDARFVDWQKGQPGTLFCTGMPGAGKTMLATIIVEHLRQSHPDALVGYAYFNYKANAEQTPAHMLGGIFRELVRHEIILPSNLLDLHRKQRTGPSEGDLVSLLGTLLDRASPPKCFIVIDALDEASSDERSPLLDRLFALQSATGFSFLATSRSIPNISSRFEFNGVTNLEIRASKDDLTRFVEGQIPTLSRCVAKSQDLQNMVIEVVSGAVDGMFLLASLHMVSLKDKLTPRSIKAALHALPRGLYSLSKTYDGTMDRINAQTGDVKQIAVDALMWITFSKRTLSVEELRRAIAIESEDESSVEEDNLAEAEDILSACAGLITLEDVDGTSLVRFIHYTAQEYFTAEERSLFPNAKLTILTKCLGVLGFESERTATLKMLKRHSDSSTLFPSFFLYATVFWIAHARETPEELALSWTVNYLSQPAESLMETIYLCLRWQPHSTVRLWRIWSIPEAPHDLTGLHLAAALGDVPAIRGLLALGVDINVKSKAGWTPLYAAVAFDEPESIQTILDEGVVIDESHDILSKRYDITDMMESFLLSQGNIHEDYTPLRLACRFGNLRAAKVLIGSGANVELSNKSGVTPLSHATRSNSLEIVKLLLGAGASTNTTNFKGQTLLHIAAISAGQEMLRFLLAKGLDVHAKSKDGSTALHTTARFRTSGCVKVLVDAGAEVDARDNTGRTPLHAAAAATWGTRDSIKILLDAGAEVDARDDTGQTPLHLAALSSKHVNVKILLSRGARADALTHDSITAKQLVEAEMIVLEREKGNRRELKHCARIIQLLSRWQGGETADAGFSSEESSDEEWLTEEESYGEKT